MYQYFYVVFLTVGLYLFHYMRANLCVYICLHVYVDLLCVHAWLNVCNVCFLYPYIYAAKW